MTANGVTDCNSHSASSSSSAAPAAAASAPAAAYQGRAIEPLNQGEAIQRRQERCNVLWVVIVAVAAYVLYNNFSALGARLLGAGGIARLGMPRENQGGGAAGQMFRERGELRGGPNARERGGVHDGVRVRMHQPPAQEGFNERGELRNGVRLPQHDPYQRGDLRQAHR